MNATSTSARLPVALVQGYGAAGLAIAFANTAVMFFLLKYMVDGAGMEPSIAGWVLLAAKGWDGVVDPLIGRLVDKTRTGFGARRPWIAAGTPALALLFAALWWPLPFEGRTLGVVYALFVIGYSTAYSMVSVPYGALTPALTQDYDERTRLNGARMTYSMLGGIVSGVMFPMLMQAYSWAVAGAVLGLMTIPPLLVTLWATRGRDPAAPSEDEGENPGMLTVLAIPAFRRTVMLFLAAWSTVTVLASLIPFYCEHHLLRKDMIEAVFAALQVSALVGVPLIVVLARRVQKHVAYAIGIGSWALVLLALAAVPEGAFGLAIGVACLAGLGVAAAHVLPWSMLPDVVEADAAEHGKERAGAFYGAMTFLEQGGTALALWAEAQVLSVAGYIPEAATALQPDSAKLAIRLLIGPIPGVILLAAAVGAILFPPMTREAHRALLERLGGSTRG